MAEVVKAEPREVFGKGASRQLRRDGRVPAVMYGRDENPVHIHFDYHEIFMEVRQNANALLKIDVNGEKQLALVKAIARNPLSRKIEHIDLLRVKATQKVDVDVPIVVEGEPAGSAIAMVELLTLPVLAPANAIPESITVDVEGAEDGTSIRVADLKLPNDVEISVDDETTVVVIATQSAEPAPEAEVAEEAEATEEAEAAPEAEAAE